MVWTGGKLTGKPQGSRDGVRGIGLIKPHEERRERTLSLSSAAVERCYAGKVPPTSSIQMVSAVKSPQARISKAG